MTTQNTNKTYFFDNKEEYLTFKKQWSDAVNSDKAKKQEYTDYNGRKQKKPGWIRAEHHIVYNILRDKPVGHGFTPITSEKKLANGMVPNQSFLYAKRNFEFYKSLIEKKLKDSRLSEWEERNLREFMAPFGGHLPLKKIAEFHTEEHR